MPSAPASTIQPGSNQLWDDVFGLASEQREELFVSMVESLFDGLVVTDPEGRVLHLNAAMERISGWGRSEARGRPVWELLLDPKDWPKDQRRLPERQAGQSEEYEVEAVRKDGQRRIWRVRATPFLNCSRQFLGTIGAVSDVTEARRLGEDNALLREEIATEVNLGHIVGSSLAIRRVVEQIKVVAPTDATVLILGESGTGKELVARALHEQSRRRERPLVRVNCAAVPRELFESEFFGHARGAFTGAVRDRTGRFELADGGTLFLDEVGEIPLELQSKLLRVLQEGSFERVGEEKTRRSDVRIVAATNRDLLTEARSDRFRADLFYRLSVFPVESPPLRARAEDVPALAEFFLARAAGRLGVKLQPRLTKGQARTLVAYAWPGNVRELENVVERAVILAAARDGRLEFDLPGVAGGLPTPSAGALAAGAALGLTSAPAGSISPLAQLKEEERLAVLDVLRATRWRVHGPNGAAARLGVNAFTLTSRLKRWGLERHGEAHRAFLRGGPPTADGTLA